MEGWKGHKNLAAGTGLNKTDWVLLEHGHAIISAGRLSGQDATRKGCALSFQRRVTVQECHLSAGASGVKCDITQRPTQIA